MASVQEIIDRLAEEDPYYGLYRPGLGEQDTHRLKIVTSTETRNTVSWLPNRKVVAGMIAGAVSWAALRYLGVEIDPEIQNAIVVLAMTGISYLVPLPDAPAEDAES